MGGIRTDITDTMPLQPATSTHSSREESPHCNVDKDEIHE